MSQGPAERSRQRRTLLLIGVLFLLPVAASFYLYYVRTDWRPAGTTNHGELIEPPRALPSVTLRSSDGAAIEPPFEKAWSLIYVGDGDCDGRCREALYLMRQVRLALNRDSDRVQRIFLYRGDCCDASYFSQQQGLMKLDLDTDVGGRLMRAFPSQDRHPAESGRIWLADPHGNLIMSYTPGMDPKGMLEDLKRLLKLSHIG